MRVKCPWCGKIFEWTPPKSDIPVTRGNTMTPDPYITECEHCNKEVEIPR
jgi:hypothetical protein